MKLRDTEATLLAGCKRICEAREAKTLFYPLLLVFGLIMVAAQPLQANNIDTWTTRTSVTSNDLNGLTYVNSTFVAVGDNGTILTSSDGVTWTARSSGTSIKNVIYGVTYGNSTFVAVGASYEDATSKRGTGLVLTSLDGTTWTTRTSGASRVLHGVIYGNSTFVAVGDNGTIITSSDGVTWTTRTLGTTANASVYIYGVTYGNSTFVAVGGSYVSSTIGDTVGIFTSPDGMTWKSVSLQKEGMFSGATYGNSIFAAMGNVNRYTDDDDPKLVKNIIITSKNGNKWSMSKPPKKLKQWFNGIIYGNSTFVIVGNSGTILTSPNGKTWTIRTSGTSNSLNGVTYGNSTFVAVGGSGTILTSSDGVTWTER